MTKLDQIADQAIQASDYQAPSGVIQSTRFRPTLGHWLLLATALLVLVFILFLSLAKSVAVNALTTDLENPDRTYPVPAAVSIDALVKLPVGSRVLVLPGTYAVEVQAEGYATARQELLIEGDKNQNFDVVLQRLPGVLDVQLEPSVAARVSLNGEEIGQLPGLLENIPAGRQELVVDAPLYRPVSQSVLVQGMGQTQSLTYTLQPAWALVTLESTPAKAAVYIDEELVGETPLQLKVEEGPHELRLTLDKHQPFTDSFNVMAEQDLALSGIQLEQADGLLDVETQPSGAAVIVNGEFAGESPIQLALRPDKPQKLQLFRAGYRLREETISVGPAEQQSAAYALSADAVNVQFSISPADAKLVVDGVTHGQGSKTLSLSTLPHRVQVSKDGYVTYQNTVIPTRAGNQVVSIKLMTREQHFWANVPARYSTSEGQDMLLFRTPGNVQLGSSRRETGRRSNETAYSARLSKPFFVSTHEVTNKEFRQFRPSHSSGNYKRRSLDSNKHPVANVSWQDAARYCNWLSEKEGLDAFYQTRKGYISGVNPAANGYRLLTEHEWAWLARNTADGKVKTYAWGDAATPPSKAIDNFADKNAQDFIAFTLADYDDGFRASSPVGRFPANERGLYDLGGNVAEWVNDWYSPNTDLAGTSNKVDWLGPEEGEFHVIRGGSWARGHLPQLRLAYRDFGAKGVHDVGFRLARYVGEPK